MSEMLEHMMHDYLPVLIHIIEIIGIFIIVTGVLKAFVQYLKGLSGNNNTFGLRHDLGTAMVTGLEFKMAAEILRTVIVRTKEEIIMLAAIMVFQVCVILGQSLNLSSLKIMQSQIQGHNYEYDIRLEHVTNKEVTNTAVPYLYQECEVILADKNISIPHTIIGMYGKNDMYIPENGKEV